MKSAYLALDFDTGPKYVPLVMSGNVASFKNPEDVKYTRALLETWLSINMIVNQSTYMGQ